MAKKKPAPTKAVTKPTGPARSAGPTADPVEPDTDEPAPPAAPGSSASAPVSASDGAPNPAQPVASSRPPSNGAAPAGADAAPRATEAIEPAPPRAKALPTGRIPVSGDGPVRTTQALQHGAAAYGARFIKPGFATTKAGDLAFALGFPHLEYIVDDHPDDARAEMIAYERRSYRLGWPRNVAIRWCRITASKGFKRTPQGATELDGAGKKAIRNGSPLSFEEVGLSLKSMFSDTSSYEDLR